MYLLKKGHSKAKIVVMKVFFFGLALTKASGAVSVGFFDLAWSRAIRYIFFLDRRKRLDKKKDAAPIPQPLSFWL